MAYSATSSPPDFRLFWETEMAGFICSRSGINWKCRSPFREDRHPSVSVNIESGLYHDFGDDHGMNAATFLMKKYGFDFPTAKEYLYSHHGTSLQDFPARLTLSPIPEPHYSKADFRFAEVVLGGFTLRRDMGRIRPCLEGLLLDRYGIQSPQDCFASVYLHSQALRDYAQDEFSGEGKGSISGYSGPVRVTALPFDLDSKEGLRFALEDTRTLVETLMGPYRVSKPDIRIFYSGRKGFHVLVLDDTLSDFRPSRDLPEKVKYAAKRIANGLKCFDPSIYHRTALLRITNTRHGKSGLFKIPLTWEECQSLSPDEIQALARAPRRFEENVLEVPHGT
jgi:CHC2 zinc finger